MYSTSIFIHWLACRDAYRTKAMSMYMNMRVCMHILKTFMKIAAHVNYYLSPMIPAEP